MAKHILSVLVENNSGVLTRIAGLFSRRGFNIDSLTVGKTQDENISRVTIVVDGDNNIVDQVRKQLAKIIDVKMIKELQKNESVLREVALIKVNADTVSRSEIIQIAEIFRARIVDVTNETLTIEVSGPSEKVDAIEDMIHRFGVKEMVRTGMIAIERGTNILNLDNNEEEA